MAIPEVQLCTKRSVSYGSEKRSEHCDFGTHGMRQGENEGGGRSVCDKRLEVVIEALERDQLIPGLSIGPTQQLVVPNRKSISLRRTCKRLACGRKRLFHLHEDVNKLYAKLHFAALHVIKVWRGQIHSLNDAEIAKSLRLRMCLSRRNIDHHSDCGARDGHCTTSPRDRHAPRQSQNHLHRPDQGLLLCQFSILFALQTR